MIDKRIADYQATIAPILDVFAAQGIPVCPARPVPRARAPCPAPAPARRRGSRGVTAAGGR